MAGIPDRVSDVHITKVATDFTDNLVVDAGADGILMANSLHFVKDKLSCLKTLKSILKPNGILLIVEYEMKAPTQWVPYPMDFKSLQSMVTNAGFSEVSKIATGPSRFNPDGMYSARVR